MDALFHKGMELAEIGKHDKALVIFWWVITNARR